MGNFRSGSSSEEDDGVTASQTPWSDTVMIENPVSPSQTQHTGKSEPGSIIEKLRNPKRANTSSEHAPSMSEYPNKKHVPDETVNVSYIDVLKERVKQLGIVIRSLSQAQRRDVKSTGFDGILRMYLTDLPADMFPWLVQGFNPETRVFSINGQPSFVVTGSDVAGLFKLNSYGDCYVVEDDRDEEVQQIVASWKQSFDFDQSASLTVTDLGIMLALFEEGGVEFKRLFVLFVIHVLLAPTASQYIRVGLIKSVVDVDAIRKKNWCKFILDHLCQCVHEYRSSLNSVSCEGSILVLMITYFHKCPWKGIPNRMEVPLIEHWPSYKIEQRIREEILGGGFGSGYYDNGSFWPRLDSAPATVFLKEPRKTITFEVGEECQDDQDIARAFPNFTERRVATLVRNLNVVLFEEFDGSVGGLAKLVEKDQLSLDYVAAVSPNTLQESLDEVITNLATLSDVLQRGKVRSQYTLKVVNAASASVDNQPWDEWMPNLGNRFVTKLVSRCAAASLSHSLPPPHELEIADFCIGHQALSDESEALYHDGRIWLLRRHMSTFNHGVPISPEVVAVWCQILNARWSRGREKQYACLPLLNQAGPELKAEKVIDRWLKWSARGEVDVLSAEMIFIPVMMGSHNYIVVLNFKEMKLQCIDDYVHDDESDWGHVRNHIAVIVCDFLDRLGFRRAVHPSLFKSELLCPVWSTRNDMYDRPLALMHALDTFSGSVHDLRGLGFNTENVRDCMRVRYCAEILLDVTNVYKTKLLAGVGRFVCDKAEALGQDSSTISKYYARTMKKTVKAPQFKSNLVRSLFKRGCSLTNHVLKIVDFCLTSDGETPSKSFVTFTDGISVLRRHDMFSLDRGVKVSDRVIGCWARILNASDQYRKNSICLDVIPLSHIHEEVRVMADRLEASVKSCPRKAIEAALVFVPVSLDDHNFLIVLNFKSQRFEYMDCSTHRIPKRWERAARHVRKCVAELFRRIGGQSHGESVSRLRFTKIITPSTYRMKDWDNGVNVMFLMQNYTGWLSMSPQVQISGVDETRASLCSQIVQSETNLNARMVLSKIRYALHEVNTEQ